jgi:hypothetical protein
MKKTEKAAAEKWGGKSCRSFMEAKKLTVGSPIHVS